MMKYQYLAVVFVIIMLPISLVFSAYLGAQLQTLDLQLSYDTKLDNTTYDAIKAFQLNTVNSGTSDFLNSKIRDIEAAANSFFTSLATNFNMAGYNSEVLQEYVPALVFTLYDGFYIYSPFENTLDADTASRLPANATYTNGEEVTGLKPYIYYSCRYVSGQIDVTITYSLDNYITIQGTDRNGKAINDAGYLIDDVTYYESSGKVTYRGIEITEEAPLEEYVGDKKYQYVKINGQKYYLDESNPAGQRWFYLDNGKMTYLAENFRDENNNMAYRYYKEAAEFKKRLDDYGILNLRSSDARSPEGTALTPVTDIDGNIIYDFTGGDYKIFDFSDNGGTSNIEEKDSNFNDHRLAVIRYVIETNLSVALANYNNYGTGSYEFRMPKLAEEEWSRVLNNVCLISFLQGLSIGGKIYNGYSVINNNKNEEVVTEESIYIVDDVTVPPTTNSTYHRLNHKDLTVTANTKGIFNIDLERKSLGSDQRETTLYYFPRRDLGCYTCFVAQTNIDGGYDNVYDYLDSISGTANGRALAKVYYTALGRERYSMYKVFRNGEEHTNQFR